MCGALQGSPRSLHFIPGGMKRHCRVSVQMDTTGFLFRTSLGVSAATVHNPIKSGTTSCKIVPLSYSYLQIGKLRHKERKLRVQSSDSSEVGEAGFKLEQSESELLLTPTLCAAHEVWDELSQGKLDCPGTAQAALIRYLTSHLLNA